MRHLHTKVAALQSSSQLSEAGRAAMALPTTHRIALVPPTGSGTPAAVVLTVSGTGFVVNNGLAPLPAPTSLGVAGGRTVSLGLLGPRPRIVPFSVAGGGAVSAVAITDEQAGGVVQPTNRPVAEGAVSA